MGTFVEAEDGEYDRLAADSVDHDWLPNATARFRIGDDIQIRFGYAKPLRRPNFEALNPAITLNQSNNPLVQSTGNAGNPDLKAQKSESLDARSEEHTSELQSPMRISYAVYCLNKK